MQDHKICDTRVYNLNPIRGHLRSYNLAPFTVFDSFFDPFLPCQRLFTFVNKKLPPTDQILKLEAQWPEPVSLTFSFCFEET